MSVVCVTDLSKHFNGRAIIEGLTFRVEQGERVVFTGESGKGKSTLLKMLVGLVEPDSGTIEIDGVTLDCQTAEQIRRKIAYLPQGVEFIADRAEELLQLLGVQRKEVVGYLNRLSLTVDVIGKPLVKLSGGEKQRLITSVVLALNRPIVLMDEPTSALDARNSKKLMDLLSELRDRTVISTSHHPDWIRFCTKTVQL